MTTQEIFRARPLKTRRCGNERLLALRVYLAFGALLDKCRRHTRLQHVKAVVKPAEGCRDASDRFAREVACVRRVGVVKGEHEHTGNLDPHSIVAFAAAPSSVSIYRH